MQYYVSRYLNVIDMGNTALLFNGVNGCLDEIPLALANSLKNGSATGLRKLNKADRAVLLKRGHITTLSPDSELQRFRAFAAALHQKREAMSQPGGIMLLMSYACNLSCKYCYQQEHRPHKAKALMTTGLLKSIFETHLKDIIPNAHRGGFSLSFYGGEPFLPANKRLIQKALAYAAKYSMSASAISNATLLHKYPGIFGPKPGLVNHVQVSLDGSRELHDSSRIPKSGEKTFDRITDNIAMLIKCKTKVSIRLNLDRRTLGSVPKLMDELKAKNILGNEYATVYASPLNDNIAKVDATDFMDVADLSARVLALGIDLEHPISLRANAMSYLFNLEKGVGLTHTCFCMQTMQRVLVVDPYGDLYACFEEAGYPEYRVGHVSTHGVEFFPLHEVYKKRHVANMKDCLKCPVALACGGQCGVKSRVETGDLFKPNCSDMRRVILDGLKFAYLKRKSNPMDKIPCHCAESDFRPHG